MATTLQDLTVVELKEILRWKNMSSTGNKAELVAKIQEIDKQESWKAFIQEKNQVAEHNLLQEELQKTRLENENLSAKVEALKSDLEKLKESVASRDQGQNYDEQLRTIRAERVEMARQLDLARQELERVRLNRERDPEVQRK
ncbi:differentially expressed in FDCP 6 homolog [Leptopilina boulardi]|uniref:differentially expressed in FDCP 6 homolog n=1 Tax=Leptopilina boulardi TaxID=63433 RepID=UPI0021F557BA|nr:differentially expressed in FDCP 6 homolog [Leptopilina boulardi]